MAKDFVQASDNSMVKRFLKNYLGQELIEDMSDEQLKNISKNPNSVFGHMKAAYNAQQEQGRRKTLLAGAYKDKVLRDMPQIEAKIKKEKAWKNFLKDRAKLLRQQEGPRSK